MNMDEAFPSKFLKASDLQGRKHTLTIAGIEMDEVGDGPKPIVYFNGKDKGLVLNKTNTQMIVGNFGAESDGWIGKNIILYPTKTQYQGQMVDAIRVEHVLEFANESENPAPDF